MPSCSSFCVCVAELWTVLETSSDSVCSFSSFSSLGSLSLFTSFTAEAHSVFSCDYVHSVHEFHFVPNRCVGACRGSGCRPGVLFGVSSGAVDGLEGQFGVARMF